MNLYWVYDLPNWLFGTLTVVVFLVIGLGGLFLSRGLVRRVHRVDHSHNDIVGYYLSALTVFYGITLGLLAIGTWTVYADVESRVEREAVVLGGLYRDISAYPEPIRSILQQDLRTYTRQVIDVGWPMQQRGVVPNNAAVILDRFQKHFISWEPQTESQKILATEVYKSFNDLIESRRARLNSVTSEMPGPLWTLVILGAVICIAVTWFFHTASLEMHIWMTILFSGLLGLMIYLVAALDNPFRGKVSVSPQPLEQVYEQTMLPQK
jgi:Protein of unknown function (DUF4239)